MYVGISLCVYSDSILDATCHTLTLSDNRSNTPDNNPIKHHICYRVRVHTLLNPLRPKDHFHIFCLFDCKILTECAIFKCKVSFFSENYLILSKGE